MVASLGPVSKGYVIVKAKYVLLNRIEFNIPPTGFEPAIFGLSVKPRRLIHSNIAYCSPSAL